MSVQLSLRHGIGWHRVGAMLLRHWYLLTSSWPRLLELVYWPMLTLISWGFLQNYINGNASFFARAGGIFIGAIILWDILFRGQLGFSMSFLEEMWSRNLGNLMMSPLTPVEFLLSLMIMSIIRLAIGHYRGRMTEVARRLGIGRSTLYRKLGELGIDTAA